MPKMKEPPKKEKPTLVATPEIVDKTRKDSRIVFRVFEQLIHVEEARRQVGLVGLYVGQQSDTMANLKREAVIVLEKLEKLYYDEWKVMQGEQS